MVLIIFFLTFKPNTLGLFNHFKEVNMKNALLLFLPLIFSGTIAFAQTDKQIEEISDKTCDCLNKKIKTLKDASSEKIEIELGLCMLNSANKVGVDVDVTDPNGLETLGERVGYQMAFSCPNFLDMIGQMMEEDPEFMEEILSEDEDLGFISTTSSGSVLEVSSGDFVTLKINSDTGRKETYYWMEHFDGANLLENNGTAIKGKDVSVSYYKMEVYSPKLGDYVQIRILRSLEIIE